MKIIKSTFLSDILFLTVGDYSKFDLELIGQLRSLPLQNKYNKDFLGSSGNNYMFARALENPKYLDLSLCRGKKVSVEITETFKTCENLLKKAQEWSIEVLKYKPITLIVLGHTELKKYVFDVFQNGTFKVSHFEIPKDWKEVENDK